MCVGGGGGGGVGEYIHTESSFRSLHVRIKKEAEELLNHMYIINRHFFWHQEWINDSQPVEGCMINIRWESNFVLQLKGIIAADC